MLKGIPIKQKTPREKPFKPRVPPPPKVLRFFAAQEDPGPTHENDIDIWVPEAELFVRLTPLWRGVIARAANRFRTFRGPVRDETMVLHYNRDKAVGDVDIFVVSQKKLRERKGNRIAIHDSINDVFVLMPEDLSERIRTAATEERTRRKSTTVKTTTPA